LIVWSKVCLKILKSFESKFEKEVKKPKQSLTHSLLPAHLAQHVFFHRAAQTQQPAHLTQASPLPLSHSHTPLTGGAHLSGPSPTSRRPLHLPGRAGRPMPGVDPPPRASSPSLQCAEHSFVTASSRPASSSPGNGRPTEPTGLNGGRRRARRPPPCPRLLPSPLHL
jgi:hypothetical protein